jgi:esterase/lipase superfamily enzyme
MAQRLVHFATNRIWDRQAGCFGFVPETPRDRLWLGTVAVGCSADPMVDGACSPADLSGSDDFGGDGLRDGACSAVLAAWLATAEARDAVPVLSVHGFDYSFEEACARAGNLCDWLEAEGGIRLVPLAFTWPSNGIASLSAYFDDQQDCMASGVALARLVRRIAEAAALHRGRKPAWIAHSMGARATRCAMQALAQGPDPVPPRLFGQALVMAGDDDIDVLRPGTGALRPLLELADWTTIGVYAEDATLSVISAKVQNRRPRLGASGPDTVPDPAERCFVVDYAQAVEDKHDVAGTTEWNYMGHQYYRNDARVRRDMVAALLGASPAAVPGRRWGVPDPTIWPRERADRLYAVTG